MYFVSAMHNSLCFVCLRIIQCIQSHRWICRTSFNHHSHVCNTSFHFLRLFFFIDKQRNYQFYSHGLFTILFKVNLKYPLTAKYCSTLQRIIDKSFFVRWFQRFCLLRHCATYTSQRKIPTGIRSFRFPLKSPALTGKKCL